MTSRSAIRYWLIAALAAACGVTAHGQSVSQPTLTAAFLYNFAKFTEWPLDQLPRGGALEFCVADVPVADALQIAVAGRSIGGHALVVTAFKVGDSLRTCAVVYASDLDAKRSEQLLAGIGRASVLAVGDSTKFVEMGGIVRLYPEGGQMRFAINVAAAARARLTLSSQLLALAKIIKDGTR